MKKYIAIIGAILLIAAASIAYAQGILAMATGGGWIKFENGEKATFGFVAHPDGGEFQYNDHATGQIIHGKVTNLEVLGDTATFTVTTTDDATYEIEVVDLGEPGTYDYFYINGEGGKLEGGNIRVFKKEFKD